MRHYLINEDSANKNIVNYQYNSVTVKMLHVKFLVELNNRFDKILVPHGSIRLRENGNQTQVPMLVCIQK